MQNNDYDILTLFNPSDEPFPIIYNGQVHKIIQPNQSVRVIKMIGGLALKHLVDHMLNKENIATNIQAERDRWTSKILQDVETNSAPLELSLDEKLKRTTETLNTTSDLDRFVTNQNPIQDKRPLFDPYTGERLPDETNVVDKTMSNNHVSSDPIVQGITSTGESRTLPEQKMDDAPAETQPQPKSDPTREDLINFAKNTLMMNVEDPKTKAELESQDVEQLKKTLNYEAVA